MKNMTETESIQGEARQERDAVPLFRSGAFTLASGERSPFKIDCDALTSADWATLAAMVEDAFPLGFSEVVGVPTGGFRLAEALQPWANAKRNARLVVDDVLTTGRSIQRLMGPHDWGFVVFARRPPPTPRIRALFQMTHDQRPHHARGESEARTQVDKS